MHSICTFTTMNTANEKDQFRQVLLGLCHRCFPGRDVENLSLSELAMLIGEQHPGLHELIRQMIQSLDVNEFIRQDHELRMKMRDVWEYQIRQGTEQRQLLRQQISKLAELL